MENQMIQFNISPEEQVKALRKMVVYQTPEDIPDSLKPYVWDAGEGMINVFRFWVKHKFLNQSLPLVLPTDIEEIIRIRRDAALKYLNEGKPGTYLSRIERPWRLGELLSLYRDEYFSGSRKMAVTYWQLVADFWTDAEHSEEAPIWRDVLSVDLPYREAMTKREDRAKLARMPEVLTVYKGMHVEAFSRRSKIFQQAKQGGHSWSLSKKTAKFFAHRLLNKGMDPVIATGTVPKKDVIAYLTNRGEEEIVAPLGSVDVTSVKLSR